MTHTGFKNQRTSTCGYGPGAVPWKFAGGPESFRGKGLEGIDPRQEASHESRKTPKSRFFTQRATRVRYAVVGAGWIAQEAVLPAFANVPNSELAALITSDPKKAEALGRKYEVKRTAPYAQYDRILSGGEIDAVYIVLPNNQHRDYSVRAARAGVYVLAKSPWRKRNRTASK